MLRLGVALNVNDLCPNIQGCGRRSTLTTSNSIYKISRLWRTFAIDKEHKLPPVFPPWHHFSGTALCHASSHDFAGKWSASKAIFKSSPLCLGFLWWLCPYDNLKPRESNIALLYIWRGSSIDFLLVRVFNMLGPLRIIKIRLYTITHIIGLRNNLHVHQQHK